MNDYTAFGTALALIRTQAGWSTSRLARGLGVSTSYLSKVERGEAPPLTLQRIRDVQRLLDLNGVAPLLHARWQYLGVVELEIPTPDPAQQSILRQGYEAFNQRSREASS